MFTCLLVWVCSIFTFGWDEWLIWHSRIVQVSCLLTHLQLINNVRSMFNWAASDHICHTIRIKPNSIQPFLANVPEFLVRFIIIICAIVNLTSFFLISISVTIVAFVLITYFVRESNKIQVFWLEILLWFIKWCLAMLRCWFMILFLRLAWNGKWTTEIDCLDLLLLVAICCCVTVVIIWWFRLVIGWWWGHIGLLIWR